MVQNIDPNTTFQTAFNLQQAGSPSLALPLYQSVLDMNPTSREVCSIICSNMGLCWMELKNWSKAIHFFQQATKWQFDWSHQWHLSLCFLHNKEWDKGMSLYPSRYMQSESQTSVRLPKFPIPQIITPESVGTQLLVMGEQGLGDQIMFSSALGALKKNWQKVVVNVAEELVELFNYLYQEEDWIYFEHFEQISGEKIVTFDGFLMMGDLFSWIEPQALFSSTNAGTSNGPIGWCWHTNRVSPNSSMRSLDHNMILQSDKEWISLQYGEGHNLSVLNTWHLLDTLSEVWTCDSFIAHLAGMKGIKTILFINQYLDWRWKQVDSNNKSILYPNVELRYLS